MPQPSVSGACEAGPGPRGAGSPVFTLSTASCLLPQPLRGVVWGVVGGRQFLSSPNLIDISTGMVLTTLKC